MEKTKLGVSVGLLGAGVFAAALFGGYVAAIILAGYVLLMESNEWLRRTAVKAVVTLVFFSFILAVINLIPDALNWIASIPNTFGANVHFSFFNDVFDVITDLIGICKVLTFITLIFKALNLGTIKLPVIDDVINKYV